ncbi:MAG: NAD(P)-dependent oxidoreductase [Bacteroidota bacterium]
MSDIHPMNILVVGATGRTGRLVQQYALEAGHHVTGVARSMEGNFGKAHERQTRKALDVRYAGSVKAVVAGHDAIISTLGAKGEFETIYKGIDNIVKAMQAHGIKRIISVGGSGVLEHEDGGVRYEQDGFPPVLVPAARAHFKAYEILKASGLDWTFVAPPFTPEGKRTGEYVTATDKHPENAKLEISVEDLADFCIRELHDPQYIGHRVGIAYPEGS